MIIEYSGKIPRQELVEIYIINLLKCLRVDRRKNISISFKFKNRLPGQAHGLCTGDKDGCEIEISKNQVFYEQMLTLAHEVVHAKQFIKEEYPSEMEAKSREYDLFGRCFPWEMT